ncbi:MAG TPA: TasA family protein [Jatrophihabitantaceae bacterium]|nr:TasA family protein [Jatrophihabitantaceae bacterium]
MKRKLVSGIVAGVAALALTAGGVTYAAFSDFSNVDGNTVGAGILKLDLGADRTGSAPLSYTDLKPGSAVLQSIWVSNDHASTPAGNLTLSFTNIQDDPALCATSMAKVLGELQSGIGGCSLGDVGAKSADEPEQGNLSRVLSFSGAYYPGADTPAECASVDAAGGVSFLSASRGNLAGAGAMPVDAASGVLVLNPGDGACIGIEASWSSGSGPYTPSNPSDDAAQFDKLDFNLRVDLVQQ